MKVIFLDVDGVLCPLNSGGQLPEHIMDRFANMVNRFGYTVVLSSSWREYQNSLNKINHALMYKGVDLFDYVPPKTSKCAAISKWLDLHEEGNEDHERIEKYVVLDDDYTLGNTFPDNFVLCKNKIFDAEAEEGVVRILSGV